MKHLSTKRKKPLVIGLFIIGTLLAIVQACKEEPFDPKRTGSIEGQVLDEVTDEPLKRVSITTRPATEAIITDSTGSYKIANIDTGEYQVIAEKKNYQRKSVNVFVSENQTSQVVLLMSNTEDYQSGMKFTNNFSPENNAKDRPLEVTLTWQTESNTENTSTTYDVQLFSGKTSKQVLNKESLKDTFVHVNELNYDQQYYWQVIARNSYGDTIHSKMLSFTTKGISEDSFFYVKKVDGNYEIFAYNTDSAESSRITNNNYRDWAPKVNRESDKIGFVNNANVNSFLYHMNMNGEKLSKVTDIAVDGFHNEGDAFAWDEENGKLIFAHYQKLYEIDKDGTGLRTLATAPSGRHFREVDISPDNTKIVALTIGEKVYNSEIYLMNRDGSNQEVLIDSLQGIVASPTFTIDGKSVLYTHDVSGNENLEGRMLNSHIFRLDLATRDTTDLSDGKPIGTNDLSPTISPTGHKILFTNVVNDNSEPKQIWMLDPGGEDREMIVENGELPAWK